MEQVKYAYVYREDENAISPKIPALLKLKFLKRLIHHINFTKMKKIFYRQTNRTNIKFKLKLKQASSKLILFIYNPGQNIWNKIEKSSKIGQEKKSLISTFACF